jgi:hypothetical protein
LRLIERGKEETVAGQFHRPRLTLLSAPAYAQSRGHQTGFKRRIDFEVAEILFVDFRTVVDGMKFGAGLKANRAGTRELGRAGGPVGDGAAYRRDDDVFGAGGVFRRVGIRNSQNVAGIL